MNKRTVILWIIFSLFSMPSLAETVYQLNNKFSTFADDAIEENTGSSGALRISSDGSTVARTVSTCFSSGFCGPGVSSEQTINKIEDGSVFLTDLNTNENDRETILFASDNRVILLRTILFTDSVDIEDWVITPPISSPVSSSYILDKLFIMGGGFVLPGDLSAGSLVISNDGSTVTRNIMVCSPSSGCGFPTEIDFNVVPVPGSKVFLENRETGGIVENLVLAATGDIIILLEPSPFGDTIITRWIAN